MQENLKSGFHCISLYSSWNITKYHFHTSHYDFALSQEMLELNTNSEYTTVQQVPWVKLGNSHATQLTRQPDACKALQLHVHDRYTNGVL
jgi:hypothetical protein